MIHIDDIPSTATPPERARPSAVVGLPLAETATLLAAAGIRAGHNCKEKA